jgi:hypothetical protein
VAAADDAEVGDLALDVDAVEVLLDAAVGAVDELGDAVDLRGRGRHGGLITRSPDLDLADGGELAGRRGG